MSPMIGRSRVGDLIPAARIASAAAPSVGPQAFRTFATAMELAITFRRSTLVARVDGRVVGTLCWHPHRWRASHHFWSAITVISVTSLVMVAAASLLLPGSDAAGNVVIALYLFGMFACVAGLVGSQLPSSMAIRRLGRIAAMDGNRPPFGSWGGGMLAVDEQYRKRPIEGTTVATALVRELEGIARDADVTEMWAPTSSPDAASLYERLGGDCLVSLSSRRKQWTLWRLAVEPSRRTTSVGSATRSSL